MKWHDECSFYDVLIFPDEIAKGHVLLFNVNHNLLFTLLAGDRWSFLLDTNFYMPVQDTKMIPTFYTIFDSDSTARTTLLKF